MILIFHKPFGVLSQFTAPEGTTHQSLAAFALPPAVYPVGRLDADSEGLLLLSDERDLPAKLLAPEQGHPREYWAQVDLVPDDQALEKLRAGVDIKSGRTRPCRVWRIDEPNLPPRVPPVRYRKSVPTSWIALELTEGKNRQVRRMTAAVGHPTLRLFRSRIGGVELGSLPRGTFRELDDDERGLLLR